MTSQHMKYEHLSVNGSHLTLIPSVSEGSALIFIFLVTKKFGVMKTGADGSRDNGGQWGASR